MTTRDTNHNTGEGIGAVNVEELATNMALFVEESGKAIAAFLRPREEGKVSNSPNGEMVEIFKSIGQVAEYWLADPARAIRAQRALAEKFFDLWAATLKRMQGEDVDPVITADPKDTRFQDPEWRENPMFDFLKQAYLHIGQWAETMVSEAKDLEPHTRHKAEFYVRQMVSALAPSNFIATNPELLRETLASNGENLVRGMRMLAEDISFGDGTLKIRQTDRKSFEVGKNIATTAGSVVFENELMQLIQYAPTTPKVRARPVVIVPPWINKYYILDLNKDKSFIQWAVDQGLTVFCISWVNPDGRLAMKGFDDYMKEGVLEAIEAARKVADTDQVDLVGYCVGGTLSAVSLGYMAAKDDRRVASATFFTTQIDFTYAGDLKVFVDEEQLVALEGEMARTGYLDGAKMANAFNMLRPNDLIWPYVVNTYLKGKEPTAFDLLYWNADATRMPAANHAFYLRSCYLENRLGRGTFDILGTPIDLKKVQIPVYNLATREDHIAPAKSVFIASQFFGGPVRFVLAGSGHIAGVINPPAKQKYMHWTGGPAVGSLDDWIAEARETKGSWWPDWRAWLDTHDSTTVSPRVPGKGPFKAIEPAPGRYVKAAS